MWCEKLHFNPDSKTCLNKKSIRNYSMRSKGHNGRTPMLGLQSGCLEISKNELISIQFGRGAKILIFI